MANTYVITSMTFSPNAADPLVTITGTVNGTPVTCQVWKSAIAQAATAIAFQNLVAPAMLAAFNALQPQSSQAPIVGSFTQ